MVGRFQKEQRYQFDIITRSKDWECDWLFKMKGGRNTHSSHTHSLIHTYSHRQTDGQTQIQTDKDRHI